VLIGKLISVKIKVCFLTSIVIHLLYIYYEVFLIDVKSFLCLAEFVSVDPIYTV